MEENQVYERVQHCMSESRRRMGGTPTPYGEVEILRDGLNKLCTIVEEIRKKIEHDQRPDYMHDPLACTPDKEMS
jgi:hypothetical protein